MLPSYCLRCGTAFLVLAISSVACAADDDIVVMLRDVPADGLVIGRVDLTNALAAGGKSFVPPMTFKAVGPAGQAIAAQFVPDSQFDPKKRAAGTLVLQLPDPTIARVRLTVDDSKPAAAASAVKSWDGVVKNKFFAVVHRADRSAGLPSQVTFAADGHVVPLRWNDRLYHQQRGGFPMANDPKATVQRVAAGPLCDVVRVTARFVSSGQDAASSPTVVYDWCYFADRPCVYVRAQVAQSAPTLWHEVHVLEMTYAAKLFPQWAAGDPKAAGTLADTKKTTPGREWAAIHDGRHGIGMFACGQPLLYDAGDGSYLQAHTELAWQPWETTQRDSSAWLWIGADEKPVAAMQKTVEGFRPPKDPVVTIASLRDKIEAARKALAATPAAERAQRIRDVVAAEQLELQGRYQESEAMLAHSLPGGWQWLESGDLGLLVEATSKGISLVTLVDQKAAQSLTAAKTLPLFSIALRNAKTREERTVVANAGWNVAQIEPVDGGLSLRWQLPTAKGLGALKVEARVVADPATGSLRWRLNVAGAASPWSLRHVVFPAVAVADLGPRTAVLYPMGSGKVVYDPWTAESGYAGRYPSGWVSMQFMAAYREAGKTGLYVAVHDPWGSTKELRVAPRPEDRSVALSFEHPVPDTGRPGAPFTLCGEAVWQALRGDWFDASMIYRDWVRKEARWYPKLSANGRDDTPQWMRELCVWALDNGPREACVPNVKEFVKALGAPVGVHWYCWHGNPFDNDYPHYFPTTPGFAQGVDELQKAGVSVMPYINGRLWDTRDRGLEDFEFTKVALPAVTKDDAGKPFIESYGSKEKDGSDVRLGVMCPATDLWAKKLREVVLRLFGECGVRGVYIDQIAAAAPTLCCDPSHGHPLGGGHWWTEGYWRLLEAIRKAKPADRILTTECNGEPFIRFFDGYLTWHWQYDGQVPAFPAVYGGSIQMFGRNFAGGDTKNLALRMKVGQALVFGEQIGWIGSTIVREKENADFLRQAVHLRRKLVRYFYAGEMARPPKLAGDMPKVRADWQWGGAAMWVTTDAVLTGAWREPQAKRVVLLFANVGDKPIAARLRYDMREAGLTAGSVKVAQITPTSDEAPSASPPTVDRVMTFPPRAVVALEVTEP
jgi:hypothetical protein